MRYSSCQGSPQFAIRFATFEETQCLMSSDRQVIPPEIIQLQVGALASLFGTLLRRGVLAVCFVQLAPDLGVPFLVPNMRTLS